MEPRGVSLQQVYDLACAVVGLDPRLQSTRDLHGPAVDADGTPQAYATVLGALWAQAQGTLRPLLQTMRCGGCPTCDEAIQAPLEQDQPQCIFAAADAVEAFKAGAVEAIQQKRLAVQAKE